MEKLGRAGGILLGAEFHIQVLEPSVPHSSCLTGARGGSAVPGQAGQQNREQQRPELWASARAAEGPGWEDLAGKVLLLSGFIPVEMETWGRGLHLGPAEGLAEAEGALPPAYLLCRAGRQLGGGIRALGSHFLGGSTVSSSRNASSPAMRSSRCSACWATIWKSCGEMPWFSHHIPAFGRSEPSSQPAAVTEKGTHPLPPPHLQPHPEPLFSYPGKGRPPGTHPLPLCCSPQRRGALVSSA